MDTFAQKTMRGMTSTFGTLAAVLHLPPGCCGVGAIEAQARQTKSFSNIYRIQKPLYVRRTKEGERVTNPVILADR